MMTETYFQIGDRVGLRDRKATKYATARGTIVGQNEAGDVVTVRFDGEDRETTGYFSAFRWVGSREGR